MSKESRVKESRVLLRGHTGAGKTTLKICFGCKPGVSGSILVGIGKLFNKKKDMGGDAEHISEKEYRSKLNEEHEPTYGVVPKKISRGLIFGDEFTLVDVGGARENDEQAEYEFKDKNLKAILYLFDIGKYFEYEIEKEISLYHNIAGKKRIPLLVIGTHLDNVDATQTQEIRKKVETGSQIKCKFVDFISDKILERNKPTKKPLGEFQEILFDFIKDSIKHK